MIENYGKRALSFFLAMIMIISAMPLQVFATDNHDHPEENIVTYSEISDETLEEINAAASDQAIELADRMNAVLEVYGITADMDDMAVANQIFMADGETLYETMNQIEDLKILFHIVSFLSNHKFKHFLFLYYLCGHIFKEKQIACRIENF